MNSQYAGERANARQFGTGGQEVVHVISARDRLIQKGEELGGLLLESMGYLSAHGRMMVKER